MRALFSLLTAAATTLALLFHSSAHANSRAVTATELLERVLIRAPEGRGIVNAILSRAVDAPIAYEDFLQAMRVLHEPTHEALRKELFGRAERALNRIRIAEEEALAAAAERDARAPFRFEEEAPTPLVITERHLAARFDETVQFFRTTEAGPRLIRFVEGPRFELPTLSAASREFVTGVPTISPRTGERVQAIIRDANQLLRPSDPRGAARRDSLVAAMIRHGLVEDPAISKLLSSRQVRELSETLAREQDRPASLIIDQYIARITSQPGFAPNPIRLGIRAETLERFDQLRFTEHAPVMPEERLTAELLTDTELVATLGRRTGIRIAQEIASLPYGTTEARSTIGPLIQTETGVGSLVISDHFIHQIILRRSAPVSHGSTLTQEILRILHSEPAIARALAFRNARVLAGQLRRAWSQSTPTRQVVERFMAEMEAAAPR